MSAYTIRHQAVAKRLFAILEPVRVIAAGKSYTSAFIQAYLMCASYL